MGDVPDGPGMPMAGQMPRRSSNAPAAATAAAVVVLSTLVVAGPVAPVAAATPASARLLPPGLSVPPGLPTHLGIGLAAAPDDSGIYGWMPDSGVSWDYAYQYLAGGVNTGGGWQTWNTLAQFPLWYSQGAHGNGYVPVFSYYMLLQSKGSCGSCVEPQKDLSNLNNTALMKSYYGDFRTLMKRLGPGTWHGVTGYGGTAIVQVEPDLSGYAEQAVLSPSAHCYGHCTATGNLPVNLKAKVKGSGDADVKGYGNNYRGFNLALLHLRDLYAPNVLLAFHVSDWATLFDIGSSTDPTLNAPALGTEAGTFAAESGAQPVVSGTSTYDLVTNDVADRDAGFYKDVYGTNVWWDRLNVTFPNFTRWEAYLGAVTAAAGRPAIVWQIPLGNQWFDTEDDTWGHYQDNRAEYFFAHPNELVGVGVIALLFGAGNAGSTTYNDAMGDGTTNPASFCTTDGLSTGTICNNHASTSSDDDGGYVRTTAATYYLAPVPLP
jgi:hypothetical protein